MTNQNEILSEFLDAKTISSLSDFIEKKEGYEEPAKLIATAFGFDMNFSTIEEDSKKLVSSFKNNFNLLIQKTWVEKSDVTLKEQLIYQLDVFLSKSSWKDSFDLFLQLVSQAVFLMFGQNPSSPDFAEYALRIDPEFGIFWWYISNLPPKNDWTEEKCRVAMMLGMHFVANY